MATLRLESYDGDGMDLPDLCMQCGAPSSLRKNKRFSWFPPWIWILLFVCGLLPFAIVALVMTKRRTVNVPLCEAHKNHWLWRQLVVVGGLLALIGIFVALLALFDEPGGANKDPLSGMLCLGGAIGLIIWLIAAVIVQSTSIRPKEITDTSITLVGVADVFVEGYEAVWRPAPEQLDKLVREHWNQPNQRSRPSDARAVEDFQRAEEDEGRRPPPDAYHE
jgi:hypothetical protein